MVEEIKGYQVKGRRDGEEMTRNVLKWKILNERPESLKRKKIKGRSQEKEEEEDDGFDEWNVRMEIQLRQENQEQQEIEQAEREEAQDLEEIDTEEGESRMVEKMWDETFKECGEFEGGKEEDETKVI